MIKLIYFDVGGVIIKDLSSGGEWDKMKRNLGITSEIDEEFENYFLKNEKRINSGKDKIEIMVRLLEGKFNLHFTDSYSMLEDFVDRFEKNESMWPVIAKAKSKYKIGLFTNMYPEMLDLIRERGLIPDVEWDVIIDSSVEGVRKPQKEIYELAQKRVGVFVSEILLVENSKSHVEAAKKLGWQTFLYDSSNMKKASNELLKVVE